MSILIFHPDVRGPGRDPGVIYHKRIAGGPIKQGDVEREGVRITKRTWPPTKGMMVVAPIFIFGKLFILRTSLEIHTHDPST